MVAAMVVAVAVAVVEPRTGITFEVPPAMRCLYLPAGALGPGCNAMGEEQLSALKTQGTFVFAIDPDSGAMLMGKAITARGSSSMTDEQLANFTSGVAHGLRGLGAFEPVAREGQVYWVEHHSGVTMAAFELRATPETLAAHPERGSVTGGVIPAGDELVSLMVIASEPGDSMQSVLASVKAPPGFRSEPRFGTSRAFQLGALLGEACGGVLCVAACILGLWRLARRPAGPGA